VKTELAVIFNFQVSLQVGQKLEFSVCLEEHVGEVWRFWMTYFYICMLEMRVIFFAVQKFGQVWDKRQFYGTHSLFTDEIAPTILRNFGVGMEIISILLCGEAHGNTSKSMSERQQSGYVRSY